MIIKIHDCLRWWLCGYGSMISIIVGISIKKMLVIKSHDNFRGGGYVVIGMITVDVSGYMVIMPFKACYFADDFLNV